MHHLRAIAFFCILMLSGTETSFSQEKLVNTFQFDPLTSEIENFPSTINCMLQDHKGYMWFGTWVGLYKYDGLNLKVYKPEKDDFHCLKGRKIKSLFEDSKGYIWIGTINDGLHRFDRGSEKFIQFLNDPKDPASISNNDINHVFEDNKGNIWISTLDGLNKVVIQKDENGEETYSFETYRISHKDLSDNRISTSFQDAIGRIWVGTEKGLYYFHPDDSDHLNINKFSLLNIGRVDDNFFNHNFIYAIHEELDHPLNKTLLWLGTRAGLKKVTIDNTGRDFLKDVEIEIYESKDDDPSSLSHNRVRSLSQPSKMKEFLFIGTEDGLNQFNLKTKENKVFKSNPSNPNSLVSNLIFSFFEDRSGILWIGTGKGISKIDPYKKPFLHYQAQSAQGFGLNNNNVTGFAEGVDGIWAGTNGGGLNKVILDPATGYPSKILNITIADRGHYNYSNYVYALVKDQFGWIWAGTNGGGIYKFKDFSSPESTTITDFIHYNTQLGATAGLNDDYIICLYEDKKGNIWVGTWNGGLLKFDVEKQEFIRFKQVFPDVPYLQSSPVTSVFEDHAGIVWVGTRGGGVFNIEQEDKNLVFRKYWFKGKNPSYRTPNFINFIHEDTHNNIWIGSEGGLHHFDDSKSYVSTYDEEDGLPVDVMQALTEDSEGNFWISTQKGITRFEPSKISPENTRTAFKSFDRGDGLQGEMYYNNSCLQSKDGLMFFGGINGFNVFYPHQIKMNEHPPLVEITNFQIFSKPVAIGPDKNGRVILQKAINETQDLELLFKDNSFSFEFASLHFSSPDKNQYAYKMEGFDQDWIYTDASRNFVHYTNLDPGKYVFRVRSSNNDGVWSENDAKINLVIHPPFYKTFWAYIIYILAVVLILYFLKNWLLLRVNFRHNLMLERVKRENIEKMNQVKLAFFTNISHEIRTPLTLILGSLDRVLGSDDLNARIYNQLQVMQNHGNQLLKLISQLLDFRKIESGHMKLQATQEDINDFLKGIYLAFKELALQKNINFIFNIEREPLPVWFDKDKMEKIIYNLLSNAFKFTPDGGNVILSVKVEDYNVVRKKSLNQLIKSDFLVIEVKDDGIGMSSQHAERIFDLYYQVDRKGSYHERSGSGIGLALVRSLMELHKGFVKVESDEGRGTCFELYFPLGKKHLKEHEIVSKTPETETSLTLKNQWIRAKEHDDTIEEEGELVDRPIVLLVEDNHDVRKFLKETFSDNYKVLSARNGEEGLELAKKEIPDLIISDILMPVMDGMEFCKQIKSDEKTAHIPFILLTARTALIYRTEGLETGADDYITKPFNPTLLSLKVRNLIKLRQNLNHKFGNKKFLSPKDLAINSVDEVFLQKCIDICHANSYDPEFRVEDFGKELGMSRMQLYRKLKSLTGLSANEFIRNQRIQKAAQLLQRRHLTVAEVTYEVGFTDLKYFRKCFKDYFNVNPSEYADFINSDTNSKVTSSLKVND